MQVMVCQLCGKLAPVTYLCKGCGRKVCEACFRHEVSVCSECNTRLKERAPLLSFPLKLFVLGFVLIFVGTIFLIVSSLVFDNIQATTGIVIFVGPIPIILGSGPHSILAILLATILTILGVVF